MRLIDLKPGERFRLGRGRSEMRDATFEAGDSLRGRMANAFLVSDAETTDESEEFWFRKDRLVVPNP